MFSAASTTKLTTILKATGRTFRHCDMTSRHFPAVSADLCSNAAGSRDRTGLPYNISGHCEPHVVSYVTAQRLLRLHKKSCVYHPAIDADPCSNPAGSRERRGLPYDISGHCGPQVVRYGVVKTLLPLDNNLVCTTKPSAPTPAPIQLGCCNISGLCNPHVSDTRPCESCCHSTMKQVHTFRHIDWVHRHCPAIVRPIQSRRSAPAVSKGEKANSIPLLPMH